MVIVSPCNDNMTLTTLVSSVTDKHVASTSTSALVTLLHPSADQINPPGRNTAGLTTPAGDVTMSDPSAIAGQDSVLLPSLSMVATPSLQLVGGNNNNDDNDVADNGDAGNHAWGGGRRQ